MKAIFEVTIAHKKNLRAISNMPVKKHVKIEDDHIETRFKPSVRMSTYLVAFVVSDFKYSKAFTKDGTKVRAQYSKKKRTLFSLFSRSIRSHLFKSSDKVGARPNRKTFILG